MQTSILVTGALGTVGAEVVKLLRQSGRSVRAAGTRPSAIEQRFGSHVEATWLDFGKPESFGAALAGVERIFLMRPPAISNVRRYIFPVINAAKQAGVQQIAFLSLIGVEKNWVVPHYKIEQHILKSGLDYTFLRPSFFMQNLSSTHRDEIKDQNEIFVPAGRGKTSFIDARDIAAVAALALTEDGHANRAYDLTGAEALDYSQVAALLTDVLGRPITYRHPGMLRFMRHQRTKGTPLALAAVMAGIYTTARLGLAARLTGDLRRLLGRAPISFKQYVEDYQACWQPVAR
ncbi:MAG: SDR family oxidoreductase [Roseiflexaceae bacterium]